MFIRKQLLFLHAADYFAFAMIVTSSAVVFTNFWISTLSVNNQRDFAWVNLCLE